MEDFPTETLETLAALNSAQHPSNVEALAALARVMLQAMIEQELKTRSQAT